MSNNVCYYHISLNFKPYKVIFLNIYINEYYTTKQGSGGGIISNLALTKNTLLQVKLLQYYEKK